MEPWLAPAGVIGTIISGVVAGYLGIRKDRRDGHTSLISVTQHLQEVMDRALARQEAEIAALNERVMALEGDRAAQARRIEAHLVWDREAQARLHGYDPHASFGPPPPLHP